MKKLLTLLVVGMLSMTLAHAQWGIVAGYTSSSTKLSDVTSSAQNVSLWHAGVAYKWSIGPHAVQPSLTYNMKGATINDIDYKTGYVEASVGLQAGIDLLAARAFLVAEPFIGYQIGGNDQALKDITNKLEYGFGIGVGAEVMGKYQLRLEWFKNLGDLSTITSAAVGDALKSGNYQGIKVTAGFFF